MASSLDDVIRFANLPAHERVADLLADLLIDTDQVLAALDQGDAASLRWLEPEVRKMFDDVSSMLNRLSD